MRSRHTRIGALLLLSVLSVGRGAPGQGPDRDVWNLDEVSPQTYLEHVRFLAAPGMQGRGNGTPELEEAAEYLARQFESFGLEPAGGDGTYFQSFQLTTGVEVGPAQLTLDGRSLRRDSEFSPMRFSSDGAASGPLVFVGYGITAPEMHWDEYGDVDVTGKVVLAMRHEPQERDEDSLFNGLDWTSHATFMSKAINAKQHGAEAILFVLDPNNHDPDDLPPEELLETALDAVSDESGIPAAYVEMEVVLDYFESEGFDLRRLQREIDAELEPRSFEFPRSRVDFEARVVRVRQPVRNVLAAVRGADSNLRDEWVVVGAHYDHLGLAPGGQFSLDQAGAGKVHHGADDNASGTAGILELARIAAANREMLERSILFIGFAGEELGLLGSSYFVNNPTVDIDSVTSMINLDMIGRLPEDGRLFVSGVGTSPGFQELMEDLREGIDLRVDYSESGMGASDHMSFNIKRIPVLFFFSGLHGDYHRPTDTVEKINVDGAADVLRLAYRTIDALAEAPSRPLWAAVEQPGSTGGAGGGYGPYFGSVPDFRDDLDGVLFADVSPGSPAAVAGLVAGDILVEFAGKPIENLYDFTYALQAQQAGDVVGVVVERNGGRVSAEVTLGAR